MTTPPEPLPNDQGDVDGSVTATSTRLTPWTLVRFLLGGRQAILDVAACPHSLPLAAVLVLSAGLAREYDGADLLHEPWHLLIPHGASLLTSFLLFCMLRFNGWMRKEPMAGFLVGYRTFLSLFWMTAPLAWVYAIPVERWATPDAATQWNLNMLELVSVWRVVLITRIICVVYGAKPVWHVAVTVLLFGDIVMLTAIRYLPVPIFDMMGGVRLTPGELLLVETTIMLQLIGYPSVLVLFIAFLIQSKAEKWSAPVVDGRVNLSGSMWGTAMISVVAWSLVLPFTQPEQQLRRQLERHLTAGRFQQGLQLMSEHERSDFPPHWSPPPHVLLRNSRPEITKLMVSVLDEQPPAWVRQIFVEKFRRYLPTVMSMRGTREPGRLPELLVLLNRIPVKEWYIQGDSGSQEVYWFLTDLAADEQVALSAESRERLERVLTKLKDATSG